MRYRSVKLEKKVFEFLHKTAEQLATPPGRPPTLSTVVQAALVSLRASRGLG